MRAFISGASLVVAGILFGALIGPESHSGDDGPGRSTSVAHTVPTTATASPAPSTKPTSPPVAAGTPSKTPGPALAFNPELPVAVGFGDSITYRPNSWFRQICARGVVLQNCLNSGISGNTTIQMLARLDSDALDYRPAIVIVMGGTNDLKQHKSTKSILYRLGLMVDQARDTGAVTVLCTIPPRDHYGKRVLSVNAAIRKYAAGSDIPLLDFYGQLGTRSGGYKRGLSQDGIHPNVQATARMTALAEERLPALLHPIKEPLTESVPVPPPAIG